MRIALADPPRKESYYHANFPNLGLLYLAGSLQARLAGGCQALFLDGQQSAKQHLAALAAFEPDLYGISFTYFTRHLAYGIIKKVRERFPKLPLICGGAMPTAAPEEVLASCPANVCVLGEGEAAICELAACLGGLNSGLGEVAGIAYRDRHGEINRTAPRPPEPVLDRIPMPAWDLVDFSRYQGRHIHRASPQVHVLVSRGCPYDCNFCSNPVWKYQKPWIRQRSPASIAKEVEMLYSMGMREVYLSADELNFNESWAIAVCEHLAGLGHDDLFFNCNIRPDVMTARLAKAFRQAKLWIAHLGIDSGNQETLDGVGKRVTIEQIVAACRLLKAEGIKVFGFVMLFHAWEKDGRLHWEDPADVERTLDFCRYLLRNKLLDYMSWQVATPFPGSRLWKTAHKFNLFPDHEAKSIYTRNLALPGLSDRQVRRALRKGLWLKNYYMPQEPQCKLAQFAGHMDQPAGHVGPGPAQGLLLNARC